ncbi:hypothetical protein FRB93_011545 [Tulasnella sp. JGI-2019a]|nr:hypothetical protein FRB93_011545 [Tulasnella sp. JGI-2019a]
MHNITTQDFSSWSVYEHQVIAAKVAAANVAPPWFGAFANNIQAGVRAEVEAGLAGVRAEVAGVRADVAEIQVDTNAIRLDLANLRRDVDKMENRHRREGFSLPFNIINNENNENPGQGANPLPLLFNVDTIRALEHREAARYLLFYGLPRGGELHERKHRIATYIDCAVNVSDP